MNKKKKENEINVDDMNLDDILEENQEENKEENQEEKSEEKSEEKQEEKHEDKHQDIYNNIKLIHHKINENNKSKDPYANNKNHIEKKYKDNYNSHEFIININSNTCSTPIFNLRSYNNLNYYYNFIIHDFEPTKINNLIMCKDIHKWMSTSSLTNEDLNDEFIPLFYIKKINNKIHIYEYLKIFIHTDSNETKSAFVQKGNDFPAIEDDINELIEKGFIKDLLDNKKYTNYNLSSHDGVCNFLDKFLSLVLIPEEYIGDNVYLDIENYVENKQTYEYFFNTINADLNVFNTTF
jgi:flagellar biosynthesis GTPase FlhF